MVGPWRLGTVDSAGKAGDLCELPDPEEVAKALVAITDGAAEALDNITEQEASNGVQAALSALAAALERLGKRLPIGTDGCEAVAEVLSAQSLNAKSAPLHAHSCANEVSREEVRAGIQAVAAMLVDLRATLLSVSRGEIEEIVEAGLPLARLAVSAARASALRLQKSAVGCRPMSTVVIEDLDTSGPDSCAQMGESCGSDCPVSVFPKRRYLWQPLWPRLRRRAWPTLQRLVVPSKRRHYLLLALFPLLGLPVLCCIICMLWAAPWLLLADAFLQRAYAWKGAAVEDALDTARQAIRFWLLAFRLAARQLQRLVRHQASRLLTVEHLSELRDNCLKLMRTVGRDPIGSSKALAGHAVNSARWVGQKLPEWYTRVPRLSDLVFPVVSATF